MFVAGFVSLILHFLSTRFVVEGHVFLKQTTHVLLFDQLGDLHGVHELLDGGLALGVLLLLLVVLVSFAYSLLVLL